MLGTKSHQVRHAQATWNLHRVSLGEGSVTHMQTSEGDTSGLFTNPLTTASSAASESIRAHRDYARPYYHGRFGACRDVVLDRAQTRRGQ